VLLLEYDGKSYRDFLILLGEDVILSQKIKKRGRYLCMDLGGEVFYDLFSKNYSSSCLS
jgi:hypothetical protein